jgi:hypothetical protein
MNELDVALASVLTTGFIGALGSHDLQAALKAFMDKGHEFVIQAKLFQRMEAQRREIGDGYIEIHGIRTEARELLDALANRINEELTVPVA